MSARRRKKPGAAPKPYSLDPGLATVLAAVVAILGSLLIFFLQTGASADSADPRHPVVQPPGPPADGIAGPSPGRADARGPEVLTHNIVVPRQARIALLRVVLSSPAPETVSVDYTTRDGTAISGRDYVLTNGTLVFQPGQAVKEVQVPISRGDRASDEKVFVLEVSNPRGVSLARGNRFLITILDGGFVGEMISEVNTVRTAAGCPVLVADDALIRIAQAQSQTMADMGFFDHVNLMNDASLRDRARGAGYDGNGILGENLLEGARNSKEALSRWLSSRGHRMNVIDCRYRDMGVGYAVGNGGRTYWTLTVGVRRRE